jgi:hypothetical protein
VPAQCQPISPEIGDFAAPLRPARAGSPVALAVAMRGTLTALLLAAAACTSSGLDGNGDAAVDGAMSGADLSGPSNAGADGKMGEQDLAGPTDAGVDGSISGQDLSGSTADLAQDLVALTGHVLDIDSNANTPIAGATVQVLGASPPNQTTSAADGSYTLMVQPGATLFVGGSASTFVSSSLGVVVPMAGGSADVKMISTATFNAVAGSLSPPLIPDPTKGNVVISFGSSTAGGYGATLSAAHGMTCTLLSGNTAMYSNTTVPGGGNGLAFPNTVPGSTTIALTAPAGKSCQLPQPITNWRIDAGYMLLVDAKCM